MTVYYVSPWGADANNGLGPDPAHASNKPWLTWAKALGAAGIASGDTLQICPAVYREAPTINMTSPTAETFITGDVGNASGFKDANGNLIAGGEVRLSAHIPNAFTANGALLVVNGRDFLSFANIVFEGGHGNTIVVQVSTGSTDLKFEDCAFFSVGTVSRALLYDAPVDVASGLIVRRCTFFGGAQSGSAGTSGGMEINVPTSAAADYDMGILIENCLFIGNGLAAVMFDASGAAAFKGGGANIKNCTMMMNTYAVRVEDAALSTTFPVNVYNCTILTALVGLNANTSGQIVEDYNYIAANTARTNVAIGTHSITGQYAPGISYGQERIWGGALRPFGSLLADSALLGFGAQAGGPAVDLLNRPRPSGVRLRAYGTATAGGASTLTDSAASFGVNQFAGYTLRITGGTGSGQTKSITSNTGTVITVDGAWRTNPSSDSVYQVYWGDKSTTGNATSGSTTTCVDTAAAWGTNEWTGYTIEVMAGAGSGQTAVIASNTGTTLTFPAVGVALDTTSDYNVYKTTGITTQDYAIGAYERHDNAEREAVVTDAGSVAIHIMGAGTHEFQIPVDPASTTVSVRVRYDTAHGTANKPQASLLANGEVGFAGETVTAAAAVDTWETLTFAAFTPTEKGIVTLRLISRAAAANGLCYWDTVSVA